jgi:hypothetical protein
MYPYAKKGTNAPANRQNSEENLLFEIPKTKMIDANDCAI